MFNFMELASSHHVLQNENLNAQCDSDANEFEVAANAKNLKRSIVISSSSPDSNDSEWEADSDFETASVRPMKQRKFGQQFCWSKIAVTGGGRGFHTNNLFW